MTTREFIIGPIVLDEDSFHAWRERSFFRGGAFVCDFCGYEFAAGDAFACTYTNFDDNYSGNPNTCEKCCAIPYNQRLKIWNLIHDKEFTRNAARKEVLGG